MFINRFCRETERRKGGDEEPEGRLNLSVTGFTSANTSLVSLPGRPRSRAQSGGSDTDYHSAADLTDTEPEGGGGLVGPAGDLVSALQSLRLQVSGDRSAVSRTARD